MTHEDARFEHLAISSLTDEDCPAADQLAEYLLGTLESQAELRVAAHLRICPLCQQLLDDCRPPEPRRRTLLAQPLPAPQLLGRRSSSDQTTLRQYAAADLVVQLTITAANDDTWRITGYVTRGDIAQADYTATLRAGRRRYQQTTDQQGFFSFTQIPAGRYTLTIANDQIQAQIRGLQLDHDDI